MVSFTFELCISVWNFYLFDCVHRCDQLFGGIFHIFPLISILDLQGFGLLVLCCLRTDLDLWWNSFCFHYLDSWFVLNQLEIQWKFLVFFHICCSNHTFAAHFGTFWNKGGKLRLKQRPKLNPKLQMNFSTQAKFVSQEQWAVQQCSLAQWLHN